jgi:peroxiredoxin
MKKIFLLFVLTAFAFSFSQKQLPNVEVQDINNKSVNIAKQFNEKDKIYVFAFWATWCAPCINELDAIKEKYAAWQAELNLEVVAVSIDDTRTQKRIKPMVKGKDWKYEILLDTNQDMKRALSIVNVPYTVAVKNGKIIYVNNGYSEGAEDEMFEKLKTL